MKKYGLILVILLFVSMISMVWMSRVEAPGTVDFYVNPSKVIDSTLQPRDKIIIKPNGDTASTNSKNWTKSNLKLMPDGAGSKSDWDGRILTINPSGKGQYTQWNSSNNFTPNEDGNYTNWDGISSWWNELDGVFVSTDKPKQNETSNFYPVLIEDSIIDVPKTMPILDVKLTMLAKSNVTSDEQVQMMLALPFCANVSLFNEASGWNGWTRVPAGLGPWLNKDDYPANYIYTSIGGDRIGNFTFQGVPSGIWGNAIPNTTPIPTKAVTLCIKTWRSGDANLDQLKIYLYNGTKWSTFYAQPRITSAPGNYQEVDISSVVRTASAFNQTKIAIEKITNGEADILYIDHVYIRIAGVRYRGLKTALTTDLTSYTSEWAKNPFTGLNWTWADIVKLEAGVESVQVGSWVGRLMIDYLYISVITGGLYTSWNDWPSPNGDTNYIYSSAGAKLQASELTDHTSESWTISKVRVTAFACNPGFSVDGRVVPPSGWTGWTKTGSSPYLDAADWPLNYIYSSTASDRIGNFTFQNVTRGLAWTTVTLRIKTWRSSTVPTLKIYLYNGASWQTYTVTPPAIAAPGSYVDVDVSSFLNSEAKFNAARMALERLGASGTVYVDHAYLSISDEKIQLMVVSSGAAYYGAETALAPTYTEYTYEWATDPATGLAWTWSAIDNLQAGVQSVQVGSWTGEVRVTQIYVKVIEAATYANWDEATQDGDSTYLSAISGGRTQVSSMQNHTSEAWTIKNVQVSVVAKTDIPTDAKFKITLGFQVGATWYYDSPLSFAPSSSGYKTFTTRWGAKKPSSFGGTAWTWSDIDKLQAGVTSYQTGLTWTGEVRITQVYIIVSEAVIPTGSDWTQWDDTSPDGDVTYLSATTPTTGTGVPVACAQVSQLTNVTSPPPWNPARVRVIVNARVTEAASDEKVQPIIAFQGSSTKYTPLSGPAEYTMTTSYANYTGDWGINPATNLNWTWADINRTEAGVQSILGADNIWTGEIRVTQIVVEVVGPFFSVGIAITNADQLFGFDFTLNYNTTVLSATNVAMGPMCPVDAWVLGTEINDAVGYVKYSITMPVGGINGSGTLATIYFIPDSYGLSALDFTYVKLIKYPSEEIYPVIHGGYFDNRIPGDVDSDRNVDYNDFIVLAGAYGSSVGQPAYKRNADFNQDGNIDYNDFIALAGNYGKTV